MALCFGFDLSLAGHTRTHSVHMGVNWSANGTPEALYRTPLQPSLDGNTVDLNAERSAFMENSMMYQASLRFLNGKISSLQVAIRGEI